ncbi:MBL fold metallo-hydrolase [Candidatus Bathyarchaeota archaeon]|nr:MBL fold metallo-hydrolase [Candidatus Bathyarchaeota archaeon]
MNPEKINESIAQLKVPMSRNPLGKTFSYLLLESNTLIDTGVPTDEAYAGLREQLKEHDLKPQDIEQVIITHLHNDHIGLAEDLRSYGAEIWAGIATKDRQEQMMREWKNLYENTLRELDLFGGQEYKRHITRNRYVFKSDVKPMPIDRYLEDGEKLRIGDLTLEVIWTPGHSYDHICLLNQDQRILFSGDHVLPKITSHVALYSYRDHDPLGEYLDSLKKVENIDVDTILPGHEWIFYDLKTRIKQLYRHHRNRLDEMKETLEDGPQTVYDIGSKVHWDSRPWPQMSFWTKRMAATETYAHLVYLLNNNEIKRELKDNTYYFSL